MARQRIYAVWLKGRRISTERRFCASNIPEAIWKAHYEFGCRTIDLAAQWLRSAEAC
jgi:hypothetical protein